MFFRQQIFLEFSLFQRLFIFLVIGGGHVIGLEFGNEGVDIRVRGVSISKHAEQGAKQKTITEDDRDQTKDEIQELTKRFEGKVNNLASSKETEVMDE